MPEYEIVQFLLTIKRDISDGALDTKHYPASGADSAVLESWPSGGLVQAAHAFMLEAIRRESYTMAIAMMSKGIDRSQILPEELSERVVGMTLEFCDRFCKDICKDTINRLSEKPREDDNDQA